VPAITERQSPDPCDRTFVSYVERLYHKGLRARRAQEFDKDGILSTVQAAPVRKFQCWPSGTHRARGMQVLKNNDRGNRTRCVSLLLPRMLILYLPYLCPISSSNARFMVGSTDLGKSPMTRISPRHLNDHLIPFITSRWTPVIGKHT